ncbi:MAG: glutamate--tRNA ligase family protein [Chlamydiales bacterium]|nr:glutamate--tRNA ligase family protein [Chlamydiales bacterium]
MISPPLVTRFAPSPTGYLHLGHVLSMAYVFGIAEQVGAKVLLRIEDHDRQRCRLEYEKAILDDMAWLGFNSHNWQEVTQHSTTTYRQSNREHRYHEVADLLWEGQHSYYCQCSRKTIGAAHYPGTCRVKGLAPSDDIGVRIKVASQLDCGDFLIRDSNQNYTYNYAVVIDDLDHGVNLVVRGKDLEHCTERQIWLASLLGRDKPATFVHHPLLVDDTGNKLSKRFLSEGIIKRRLNGDLPEDVLGDALYLGGLIGARRPVSIYEICQLIKL